MTITTPANGQLFAFGDTVPFQITVTDPEDGTIDCARVKMTYVLGHDSHGHQITSQTGCSGTITIPVDGEHDDAANIFARLRRRVHRQRRADHAHAAHPAAASTGRPSTSRPRPGISTFDQGRRRGRQDRRRHRQRRLDRVRPVQAEQRDLVHRPGLLGAAPAARSRSGPARPTGTVLGSATVPVTGGWETFTNGHRHDHRRAGRHHARCT